MVSLQGEVEIELLKTENIAKGDSDPTQEASLDVMGHLLID
jgi:hypothetical protein